jgi:hypothetical protein
MTDSDGLSKSVKGFRFDLALLWAASARNLLEISLPYYNQEFSRLGLYSWQPIALDDSSVRRADASGDLSLDWRYWVLGEPEGAWKLGTGLAMSFPTGQGPYSSSHPLVATGAGGLTAAAWLNAEAGFGRARSWLQARLPYEFGYAADIAPGAFVAYRTNDSPLVLAGGRAWVSRAYSYDLVAGLAFDWHRAAGARHSLALEMRYDVLGPLKIDGVELAGSESSALDFVPQARFAFGDRVAVNLGWLAPLGYAANRAVSYWGELSLRVDYGI